MQALDKADPPTVADFFRLAAHKIRQVLLDMADQQQRHRPARDVSVRAAIRRPGRMRARQIRPTMAHGWRCGPSFTTRSATLDEAERTVFEMHYYLGLPQAEIARMLELHPRKVSYLWVAATGSSGRRLVANREVVA